MERAGSLAGINQGHAAGVNVDRLSSIRGLLLDMDGVIFRGDSPTPGAAEFFQFLRLAGIRFALITNNSTRAAAQYVEKLEKMGIFVGEDDVLTVGEVTSEFLAANAPAGARVFVIGHDGLVNPLCRAGFMLTDEQPEYVVVGMDVNFTYEKLRIACQAIRQGARFIAANTDATLPVEDTVLPGGGSLVAAIEVCAGVSPLVIGKPEPALLQSAMSRLKMGPDELAIVGDRLETDVTAGKRAGICAILVLTGVTSRDEVNGGAVKPDYVFENLVELRQALENARRS